MIIKIKAGRRRPNLLFIIWSWFYSWFSAERTYVFLEESKYVLNDLDQRDINKLFGYFIGSIHLWSVRWGYRYDPHDKLFYLYEYRYQRGVRHYKPHLAVPVNTSITLGIDRKTNKVYLRDQRSNVVDVENLIGHKSYPKTRIKLHTGFYFGGNKVAPKDIRIKVNFMKRIFTALAGLNGRTRMIVSFVGSVVLSLVLPLIIVTAVAGYESKATTITAIAGFILTFALNSYIMKLSNPSNVPIEDTPTELDALEEDMKNTLQSPSQLGQPSQEG